MNSKNDDYAVAWICALPLEVAAAKAMLDEVHTSPSERLGSDQNAYTLGRVCNHNVVIACLPFGVYGTTSATAVLSRLQATFPGLSFALMVGIGGGVPNNNQGVDLRLGDVVVSTPSTTSSGVIQYDHGKAVDGHLLLTGVLNKPPSFLLTAVSKLESKALLGTRPVAALISKVLEDYPDMNDRFSRPDEDWQFNSKYPHTRSSDGSSKSDSRVRACSACDPGERVARLPRVSDVPFIHHGVIASGNQVIKDAERRDSLARELGVLCFEMEAAGLMDQLPSLVIRGISDYCDSHKNDHWQGYAALVASAYAKVLLAEVPALSHGIGASDTPLEGLWMVPFSRNPRFSGREEQMAILKDFMLSPVGPNKFAITGLGGVGKTQIALELAYRLRDQDPRCSVFWIPCTSRSNIDQAFSGLRSSWEWNHVQSYFSHSTAGKWLMIFDNVEDMEMWMMPGGEYTSPLKTMLPRSDQGYILFTTRSQKLAVKLASTNIMRVHQLNKEVAIEVLGRSLIQKCPDHEASIALLKRFGPADRLTFLPLAISQAAAYINENELQLSEYIDLLHARESDSLELLCEDFEDEGRYDELANPVGATWLVSFQQIQKQSPLAANYLSIMACVSPTDIPQALLPQPKSRKLHHEALGLLKAYSFVAEDTENKSLSLHQLVHLSARSWLRSQGKFSFFLGLAVDQLNKAFGDTPRTDQTLWRELLPHFLAVVDDDGIETYLQTAAQYLTLLDNVGICLYNNKLYERAEPIICKSVELRQAMDGIVNAEILTSMDTLAGLWLNQKRWSQAEELAAKVLEERKRLLGDEHRDTLRTLNTLSVIYVGQRRYTEAECLCRQILDIRKRNLEPDHPDVLRNISNLASIYRQQKRWDEAEQLGLEALKLREKVLGPDHPSTLTTTANLVFVYTDQNRWDEAEDLQRQVLSSQERVLGPSHPNTLASMSHLARICWKREKFHRAVSIMSECVGLCEKNLGPDHKLAVSESKTLNKWQVEVAERDEKERQLLEEILQD
ncbi:hypothetical protein BJX62DRAFT_252265 [Aspergillus germanicus]